MAIVAARTNCFCPPLATSLPDDDETVRRMDLRNILQERLLQDNLQSHNVWQSLDIDDLPQPFPVLSLDNIRSLIIGIDFLSKECIIFLLSFRCLPTENSTKLH